MRDVNRVTLLGRIVRDAEFKLFSTGDGDGVCSFSVATSEEWKDRSGETKKATQYHYCKLFGKSAEKMAGFLVKGKPVYIEGKVMYSEYTDAKSIKHHVTEIRVEPTGLILLGDGGGSSSGGSRPSAGDTRRPRRSDSAPKPPQDDDDDIPF